MNSLGMHHVVMTYPERRTYAVAAVDGAGGPGGGGAGWIVVIGVDDDTTVYFTPPGGVTPTDQIEIGQGDVAQIWTDGEASDLTGGAVRGTKPIVVLSGNRTTSYGNEVTGVSSPDMALEVMLPLAYWSKVHVAAALPPQAETCDSLLGIPGASLWRVIAAQSGTTVSFDGPAGAGLPAPMTLAAGQVQELILPGVSFTVRADGPIMVTQGMDCEPSLSLAVPVDRMLSDSSFAVLPNFAQMLDVVRPRGERVTLDGTPIPGFVAAGKSYEVAQIALPACSSAVGVCPHRLVGTFGMTLRGMDVVCGYALTVPTWEGCNPVDPMCEP